MKKDKGRYFGPYTSADAVRETIELLNRMYGLRDCRRNLPKDIGKERPCLNYHIRQCCGPCPGNVTEEEYRERADWRSDFLGGNYGEIMSDLKDKMQAASEEMEFEEAIALARPSGEREAGRAEAEDVRRQRGRQGYPGIADRRDDIDAVRPDLSSSGTAR